MKVPTIAKTILGKRNKVRGLKLHYLKIYYIWDNGKVLQMNSGNGCKIVCVSVLNCIPQNG